MATVDQSFILGNGRTGVLLIHGLGGTPIELKLVAKGLARNGFKVYCCQLAGHCGSAEDLTATKWEDWYTSVEEAFNVLRKDCDTIVAGGLSMGAVLAMHLAAKHPEDVHGLALYAPTLWYDGWAMPWYRFMLTFAMKSPVGRWAVRNFYSFVETEPYGIKDPTIRAVVVAAMQSGDSTLAGVLTTPGEAVIQLYRLVNVVKHELKTIEAPAFIVQAREDDFSSLRNTEYLQRHLGGLVDTLILDDSYHIVTVDRQRDLLIEGTVAFGMVLAGRMRMQEKSGQIVRPLAEKAKPVESGSHTGTLPASGNT